MSAPGYWMNEASGVLRPVVEKYILGGDLDAQEVATMRAYLRQWIMSPAWDMNPHGSDELQGLRDMIDSLHSTAQIHTWLDRALDAGIDPL